MYRKGLTFYILIYNKTDAASFLKEMEEGRFVRIPLYLGACPLTYEPKASLGGTFIYIIRHGRD